ncbi:hypothetical protein ASPFODRAFT_39215 [Aspergillus luchuensis CBS 106.47]|uniref:Uncharacterized protein n=1 Tax=Aspergillus luchuensis (strain CBS 106.47) TaxID=1137211 RepID=A0A1M3TZ22_ASPLC|nr:hypothetical protein ASPFODRAFT_39215 [Aspergillus luchuensis CBS 106.47]
MPAELYEYDRAPWFYFCNEGKGDKVKQVLVEHNSYAHKVVPPERLLEIHRQHGWKPLCQFLDLRKSQTLYPMRNDSGGRLAARDEFWRRCVRRGIMKITPSVLQTRVIACGHVPHSHLGKVFRCSCCKK